MQTRMKSAVLAKRLRSRLRVLQAKRKKALVAYDKDFLSWRGSVSRWFRGTGSIRALQITKKSVESMRYRGALPDSVFEGIPTAPKPPPDESIRAVQKVLRFLGITGQSQIDVSTSDMDKWFGGGEEDE